MLLLISHAGANKGVTGYFRDFLAQHESEYLYLCHPFAESKLKSSELHKIDKHGHEVCMASFWKPQNELLAMVVSFFVTTLVLLRYGHRVHLVIGFGGFNTFSAIVLRSIFRFKVYFWGVDYSSRRFSNSLLNKTYLFLETFACKYANMVIQPTTRQEDVRIHKHGLDPERSLVIPNGISGKHLETTFQNIAAHRTAFLYIGSITQQHGVLDLIKDYYCTHRVKTPLYIIGGGPLAEQVQDVIEQSNASHTVKYLGHMTPDQITDYVRSSNENFVGIAPYRSDAVTDHVYYGDSLKLKEYLMYRMPFLVSTAVEVPGKIHEFGVIYHNDTELQQYLNNPHTIHTLDDAKVRETLKSYTWDVLCSKIPLK